MCRDSRFASLQVPVCKGTHFFGIRIIKLMCVAAPNLSIYLLISILQYHREHKHSTKFTTTTTTTTTTNTTTTNYNKK